METKQLKSTCSHPATLPNGKEIIVNGELFEEPFAEHEGIKLNARLIFQQEGKTIETLVYELKDTEELAKCVADHVGNIEKIFPQLCQ